MSPMSPALQTDLYHWATRETLMEYYSAIKNEILCSNMNGPRDDHTKWSKSERERNTIWYHWYEESKYDTDELIYEKETDSQTQRADFWLPRGRRGGRNGLGVWD